LTENFGNWRGRKEIPRFLCDFCRDQYSRYLENTGKAGLKRISAGLLKTILNAGPARLKSYKRVEIRISGEVLTYSCVVVWKFT
jgi:hypothetical protein